MSATVDFRRFRTWDDAEPVDALPGWRIVLRYGFTGLLSSWQGILLLVVMAIFVIFTVGSLSYSFTSGNSTHYEEWTGAMASFWVPMAAILLLVAAPSLSEDLRFHAPLFYFSKPITLRQYLAGKFAFVTALVSMATVVPVLLITLLALVVGVPYSRVPPAFSYEYGSPAERQQFVTQWQQTHIDTVGDWLAAAGATIPAFLVLTAFAVALAMVASAYTRRGWHAAMVFVALLAGTSMLSIIAAEEGSAYFHLLSPIGWAYLMLFVPVQLLFQVKPEAGSYLAEEVAKLEAAAPIAIPLAYLLALGSTALCLYLTDRRIHREAGAL